MIHQELDKGMILLLALLAFSAAFDTINYGILLYDIGLGLGRTIWILGSYIRIKFQKMVLKYNDSIPLPGGALHLSIVFSMQFNIYIKQLGFLGICSCLSSVCCHHQ